MKRRFVFIFANINRVIVSVLFLGCKHKRGLRAGRVSSSFWMTIAAEWLLGASPFAAISFASYATFRYVLQLSTIFLMGLVDSSPLCISSESLNRTV